MVILSLSSFDGSSSMKASVLLYIAHSSFKGLTLLKIKEFTCKSLSLKSRVTTFLSLASVEWLLGSLMTTLCWEYKGGNAPCTVNSLYCGHPRDQELVPLVTRVHNSGNLFQSNVCNSFLPGVSCCPYYQGVCSSEMSTRLVDCIYCGLIFLRFKIKIK